MPASEAAGFAPAAGAGTLSFPAGEAPEEPCPDVPGRGEKNGGEYQTFKHGINLQARPGGPIDK
jgi:hypothetical protein